MDHTATREMLTMEYRSLREELRGLKNCQVNFVTFAVTGTGAVLGLGGTSSLSKGVVYLAPLLILLPTWTVFFDKATSINRIVGYMRVIEQGLLGATVWKAFSGWENNLALYRAKEFGLRADPSFKNWRPRHITKYQFIVFLTYLFLVATCLFLSWAQLPNESYRIRTLWWVFLTAATLSFIWNAYIFINLSWLKYSSRAAYSLWREILCKSEDAEPQAE